MLSRARLRQAFFRRDSLVVARDLLGRVLCRRLPDGRVLRARLVEVEAYDGPRDRASHAFRGLTPRTVPMFEAGGIVYVYQIYGVHFCMNVVTGSKGYPAAVLLRAAEAPAENVSASGPAKLCRALDVDRALNGSSLLDGALWLERGLPVPDDSVRRTHRIGVDGRGIWSRRKYRFVIAGHPAASGPRSLR
jgi:DNA-3-methyladenine glycosylase